MAAIYADGNYVIIDDGVNDQYEIAKNDLLLKEDADSFCIFKRDLSDVELVPFQIAFADYADWDSDDSATAYASEAELRTFLRSNTGS